MTNKMELIDIVLSDHSILTVSETMIENLKTDSMKLHTVIRIQGKLAEITSKDVIDDFGFLLVKMDMTIQLTQILAIIKTY